MPPVHHTDGMLVLKRTMNSATSGEWSDQEFNVFEDNVLVGRILRSHSAPSERPWLWTITCHPPGATDNRGYAGSLEAAMSELTSQWEIADPAQD